MIAIVMGVSGSGKTTIGKAVAARLGWRFFDGDDFHPPANLEKMARGRPLDDADREPWLAALARLLSVERQRGENVVLACSALKAAYRSRLASGPDVRFVYLRGSPALFRERLLARAGHFFHADLLESQFADLEEPADAFTVDASRPPDALAADVAAHLRAEFSARA